MSCAFVAMPDDALTVERGGHGAGDVRAVARGRRSRGWPGLMQLVPRPGAMLAARSTWSSLMPVSTTATRTGVPPLVTPVYPAWCAAHALVRRIPLGAISTACSVRDASTWATRGLRASAAAASAEPVNAKPSSTCEYTASSRPPSRPASCGASRGASAWPARVTIQVGAGAGSGPIGSTAAAAADIVADREGDDRRGEEREPSRAFDDWPVRIGALRSREEPAPMSATSSYRPRRPNGATQDFAKVHARRRGAGSLDPLQGDGRQREDVVVGAGVDRFDAADHVIVGLAHDDRARTHRAGACAGEVVDVQVAAGVPGHRGLGRTLEHHAEHASVDAPPAVVDVRRVRQLDHAVLGVDDPQAAALEQRLGRHATGRFEVAPLPDAAERVEHARGGRRRRRHARERHQPGGDAALLDRIAELVEIGHAVAVVDVEADDDQA